MRRGFAFLLAVCLIVSLAACGSDVTIPTRSPDNTKNASGTDAAANSSQASPNGTQAARPAESVPPEATAAVTEPETEAPHIPPKTAEKAPALTLAGLPNPLGEGTRETDPESGAVTVLVEDLGEDGHTYTRNCFDEAGNLLWYECFEYNDDEQIVCVLRKDAEERNLSRDLLIREGGVLIRKEHYDCLDYVENVPADDLGFTEDYYPNGQLAARTAYGSYAAKGAAKELTEYSEDGKETHHALYDSKGKLLEEYVDGKKVILVPDSVVEIFRLLNNDTPDEEFEETWEACLAHIEEKGQTESWEKLCHTLNGMMDEYNGSSLYWLREVYWLKLFKDRTGGYWRDKTYASDTLIWYMQNEAVNPLLFAKVYRMGCYLDFGGTVWLPMEFSMAMSDESFGGLIPSDDGSRQLLDWSSNDLRAFMMNRFGYDPLPDYKAAKEAIPEDGMDYGVFCDQLTETVAQQAGTDAETILESYQAHLEETADEVKAAAVRAEGDPIRILILDASETIMGDAITREMLSSRANTEYEKIVDRAETIYKGLFNGSNKAKVVLTSYPELADVVIEISTEYPYAGQYKYSSGTIADVWNTVVTLKAYDMRNGREVSAVFKHLAGQTVSVSGGVRIYMRIPDLTKEEYLGDAQSFVAAIFSWFPDLPQ
ncbi:MAG: hypothetical protein J5496_06940 [Lachnospiraceae bacterium]|nr:hypothetical protein [Lachnospiraceae bacterium]